jgi:hypothetical protein
MGKNVTTFRKTTAGNWMSGDNVVSQDAATKLGLEMKAVVRKSLFVGNDGRQMQYFGLFAEIPNTDLEKLKKVDLAVEAAEMF